MSSRNLTIGYSCWGFLGDGIVDTPDGGRSHRITLLQSLIKDRGCTIEMLQKNRDLIEAGEPIEIDNLRFTNELPEVDFVFLEYRWPIQGRNIGVEKTDPLYTPDLDRQNEIINHYSKQEVPILIWDKDQQLTSLPENLHNVAVAIFEPSLQPKQDRLSLLFPADSNKLAQTIHNLDEYSRHDRDTDLVYIGNQYDRDTSFQTYYLDARLDKFKTDIYGKWNTQAIPPSSARFHGRVGYKEVSAIYSHAVCNILIAPDRYYKSGQYTQRIFESLWQACIPLVPIEYQHKEYLFPEILWVKDGEDVGRALRQIEAMSNKEISTLLSQIIMNIEKYYSPHRQSSTIIKAYRELLS